VISLDDDSVAHLAKPFDSHKKSAQWIVSGIFEIGYTHPAIPFRQPRKAPTTGGRTAVEVLTRGALLGLDTQVTEE